MLSNACKYAIRSLLYLAIYADETKKVGAKKIADDLETPQPFLAKLLQDLSRKNLISSSKGPTGGFFLSDKNIDHSLWDVILSIDGTEKFDQCFMGLSTCGEDNPCPIHYAVAPFKEAILNDFKEKSIRQFAEEIKLSGKRISLKDFEVL